MALDVYYCQQIHLYDIKLYCETAICDIQVGKKHETR